MLNEYQKHLVGQFFTFKGKTYQVLAGGYVKDLQGKVIKVK